MDPSIWSQSREGWSGLDMHVNIKATLSIFYGWRALRCARTMPDKKKKSSHQSFLLFFPPTCQQQSLCLILCASQNNQKWLFSLEIMPFPVKVICQISYHSCLNCMFFLLSGFAYKIFVKYCLSANNLKLNM